MRKPLFALTATAMLAACNTDMAEQERVVAPVLTSEQAFDEFTYARPQEARVTHVAFDLDLDFEGRRVEGTATLDVQAAEDATEIVLDSDGLVIGGIQDGNGNDLDYTIGEADPDKGEPITVQLGELTGPGLQQVVITYASGPDAPALQWLDPEQTAGGEYPYVFSQGQAILNRSWIPTQDSPGIRQTWEARITAPKPLNVVMSGISRGDPEDVGENRRAFEFTMDNSIPPYLIAIAAGNIEFAELGPRSGVWAEPEVIEEAAAELSDTEAMIDAAEEIYGTYRWGRYDMIVLPPAFPYGGMENPVMTFLTPTFIAGDRSNTGLIAHELAHSWSGNLVTYASWRDGWLNEGVTSYLTNRISEAVFGVERAEQERALEFAGIEGALESLGNDNPRTALRTPDELNPLEYNSAIMYDKGALFLHTAESIIGRERFDAFMQQWFDENAFQPATSEMFLAALRENVVQGDEELEEALMLDEWIYGTGLPENAVRPGEDVFGTVDTAVAAYADSRELPDAEAWASWNAFEQRRFLEELPEELSNTELAALNESLGLSETGNNEVLFLWLEAALRNEYDPAVPQAEQFLASVGRNKFVAPLFSALWSTGDWGRPIATRIYEQTRGSYHSYTRGNVDGITGYSASDAG
ncbi:M1 family metallopeptidase [Aurantiacibacter gangjinensis]|uniref:Aminopeptidase N n=1 Tax=Aurantiacibacter gangjinensis TaxID=502682 RepID=A0A0G9MMW7_9SPHN|nr:M1 family metallopeptidase [Aurantiacibacter gangjinensis]APE28040.1 Peptidase M1, membrane alanine aminopeptidase [Aurantiacibacter gangjinensis]KLE31969.1 aminopeptidase [Aurantiacibacter gangjinensis]